jgi:hypothetical protein
MQVCSAHSVLPEPTAPLSGQRRRRRAFHALPANTAIFQELCRQQSASIAHLHHIQRVAPRFAHPVPMEHTAPHLEQPQVQHAWRVLPEHLFLRFQKNACRALLALGTISAGKCRAHFVHRADTISISRQPP